METQTTVVVPPAPFMLPSAIPGSHAADDAKVAAWIAAAVSMIDGVGGAFGLSRVFGPQTLETTMCGFPCREITLPYCPVISIESLKYRDALNAEITLDSGAYVLDKMTGRVSFGTISTWPTTYSTRIDAVKIRYVAGYNGTTIALGGTGAIPEQVKQAVILLVQHFMSASRSDLFLKRRVINGVSEREWVVSDAAEKVIQSAVGSLLRGLARKVL